MSTCSRAVIGYGQHAQAHVVGCALSLHAGVGFSRLSLELSLSMVQPLQGVKTPLEQVPYLRWLDGDLFLKTGGKKLLGRLVTHHRQSPIGSRTGVLDYTMELQLSDPEMLRLAELTQHSDVALQLELTPRFGDSGLTAGTVFVEVTSPHSEWVDLLQSANLARFETITLRTPARSSAAFPPYDEAISALKQGEAAFARGDFNAVGTQCRAGLRHLLAWAADREKKDAFELLLKSVSDDVRRTKFAQPLLKGLNDILNAATHLEGSQGQPMLNLRREDALLCLHWYSALIGYLADVEIAKAAGGT